MQLPFKFQSSSDYYCCQRVNYRVLTGNDSWQSPEETFISVRSGEQGIHKTGPACSIHWQFKVPKIQNEQCIILMEDHISVMTVLSNFQDHEACAGTQYQQWWCFHQNEVAINFQFSYRTEHTGSDTIPCMHHSHMEVLIFLNSHTSCAFFLWCHNALTDLTDRLNNQPITCSRDIPQLTVRLTEFPMFPCFMELL